MKEPTKLSLLTRIALLSVAVLAFIFLYSFHSVEQNRQRLVKRGVLFLNPEAIEPGNTLINQRHQPIVRLINHRGEIVKEWRTPDPTNQGVHFATLDKKGNLLAIAQVRRLSKMSSSGEILWSKALNAHHDVIELLDDNLLSFDIGAEDIELDGQEIPVWIDRMAIVNPESGEVIKRYPIEELIKPFISSEKIQELLNQAKRGERIDIFHCNGLAQIPEDISNLIIAGDILISCRDLNLLLIVDRDFTKTKWHFGPGIIQAQHQPEIVDGDKILLFDNRPTLKRSRVIKIDIPSKKIVWEFSGPPELKDFFSKTMGGSQQLDNGNILVSLGRSGRVLEFTRHGELAWEFLMPEYINIASKNNETTRQLYRAERFATGFP